jgi:hypothetical protein
MNETLYVVSCEWDYEGGPVLGIVTSIEKGEELIAEVESHMPFPYDTHRIEAFVVNVQKFPYKG